MPPGINKTLSAIPVKIVGSPMANGSTNLRLKRRGVQIMMLLLLVLVPISGLFRIDPENGAVVVLDWQIWFSDFFLVTGIWIMIACALVALYSVAGTVFCGWACPQNTLAEWANHMTHKLLGKRAEVSLTGEAPRVAAGKNRVLNWSLLGGSFLIAAMLFALLPLLYFYPPDVIWSFITFKDDERLAGSLHWIYSVWVMIILLDISVLRHFWCRFACVYKVWQHSFKTKETLHVAYDSSRSNECEKCNYCVTTCFLKLDPRKTEIYDSCINCGDCIDACNRLHAKKGMGGLLKFELGQREASRARRFRDNSISLLSRFRWTVPFAVLGTAMFAWGIWSYQPYHLAVGYVGSNQSQGNHDYRIELTSKRYRPSELLLSIEGLPPEDFVLSKNKVDMASVGRASITLSVSPNLKRGLYPFRVVVHSGDGWIGRFNVQHFVE